MVTGRSEATGFELRVEEAGQAWTVPVDGKQPINIGRDGTCEIVLRGADVEDQHATVYLARGRVVLDDLQSSSGVWIDDARVIRSVLHAGSEFTIGSATIRLQEASVELEADRASSEGGLSCGGAAVHPTPSQRGAARQKKKMRRAPRARKTSGSPHGRRKSVLGPLVVGLVTICAVLGGAYFVFYGTSKSSRRSDSAGELDAVAWPDSLGVAGDSIGGDTAGSGGGPRMAGFAELDQALTNIQQGKNVDDVRGQLRRFVQQHPQSVTAEHAQRYLDVLNAVQKARLDEEHEATRKRLSGLLKKNRYAQALQSAEFLAATRPEESARWKKQGGDIRTRAESEFRELEKTLSNLTQAGKSDDALRAIIAAQPRFGGLSFFDELLPRYLDTGLEGRSMAPVESASASPIVIDLLGKADIAFTRCDFDELSVQYHSVLAHDPPAEIRTKVLEALLESFYFQRMQQQFYSYLKKESVEVQFFDGAIAQVVRADSKEIEFQFSEAGSSVSHIQLWVELSDHRKVELFSRVRLGREGLVGLVLFAFRLSNEEAAYKALVRLHRGESTRALADAILARYLKTSVPEGGFVLYKGRLVTPEAKATELVRVEELRREERKTRRRLAEAKKTTHLRGLIALARELRDRESYTLAQSILRTIVKTRPNGSATPEAKELFDDPLLKVKPLEENGPSSNRLDFYIFGDGYPVDDDYQEGFYHSAVLAKNLIIKTEPFLEYQSYLNIFAVQTGSHDRGLDRYPGDVDRDSALDCKVRYDVFTCNRQKVMALLARVGEGGEDQQAVVIGNDYAGTSTGGGGVASCCKTALSATVHEIGHSLTGLHDEYDFTPGHDPNRSKPGKRQSGVATRANPPNVMEGSDKDDIIEKALWRHWIEAPPGRVWNGSKVGAFEGADRRRFNAWRAQVNCKMKTSSSHFCVVCMEQMILRLYQFVRPIDRIEPEDETVAMRTTDTLEWRLWPMKPASHFLDVRWYLQEVADRDDRERPRRRSKSRPGTKVATKKGQETPVKSSYRRYDPEGRVVEVALIEGEDLSPGRYRLRVEVKDPTPWVLKDDKGLLTQEHLWTIRVRADEEQGEE